MIEALAAIARANKKGVTVMVNAQDGDLLSVTVVPQGDFTGDKEVLSKPLQITGTLEELEVGLAKAITSYQSARQSLDEQLTDTLALLEAAKKEAAEKGKKALTKSGKTDKPAKAAAKVAEPASSSSDDGNDDGDNDGDDGEEDSGTNPAAVTPPPVATAPSKPAAFELNLD